MNRPLIVFALVAVCTSSAMASVDDPSKKLVLKELASMSPAIQIARPEGPAAAPVVSAPAAASTSATVSGRPPKAAAVTERAAHAAAVKSAEKVDLPLPVSAKELEKKPKNEAATPKLVFKEEKNLTEIEPVQVVLSDPSEYRVGVDDVIDISVLKPEEILASVTVTPDGMISFPYIGTLRVQGMALHEVQDEITRRLSDGYLKYPVVSVALKESRSRKFFVYGEVIKPGGYPIE